MLIESLKSCIFRITFSHPLFQNVNFLKHIPSKYFLQFCLKTHVWLATKHTQMVEKSDFQNFSFS
jgi:hypothetical protein